MGSKLILLFILFGISTTPALAATITVSPGESIQTKCLDVVNPGDICTINAGTYSEALSLKRSGNQQSPITLRANGTVTLNSGSAKTLVTGGRVDYYTFEGVRFLANFTPTNQSDVSIELGANVAWSRDSKTVGNHGFIFRNCYIEGAIHFFGHNNLVENCEFNGKNNWSNGLIDNFATSYDNTYQNNVIYDYKFRGIWSMNLTDNILMKDNTIHNVVHGIDCDGAGEPITHCNVINNHIYNVGTTEWGSGIFLENCFDCLIQGNIVHDNKEGPGIFDINYGNGSSRGWHTYNNIEYRNRASNTKITNNVIYNRPAGAGMLIESVNGLVIDHNTIYYVGTLPSIRFVSETDDLGVTYNPINETITNNIFYSGNVIFNNPTSGLISAGNFTSNPLFINPPTDFHLQSSSPACTAGVNNTYTGVFPCGSSPSPAPSPLPAKPGDADGDNDVDGVDYVIWLNHYNQSVFGPTNGDFNNSGKVDGVDYVVWLNNYGK